MTSRIGPIGRRAAGVLAGILLVSPLVCGQTAEDRDAYRALVELLKEDVAVDPANAESWFGLSIAYTYLEQYEDARDAALAAERADPTDPRFPDQLGEIYITLLRTGDAVDAFERAIAIDPDLFFAHRRLGGLYLELGRTVPAIEHLERARALRDWDWEVRRRLGFAYLSDGQIENALAEYSEAVRLAPAEEVNHLEMADAYFTASMADEARDVLENALTLFPGSARARLGLARLATETGNLSDALTHFEAALATPDSTLPLATIYKTMGDIHRDLVDPVRALDAYDRSIAAGPETALAHVARAEVLTGLNELDEAREAYARAIALEPTNAEAHAGIASIALLMEEPAEALEAADRALELDPGLRQALYFRGQALILLGNDNEGRRVIEEFGRGEAAARAEEQRVREIESINRQALEAMDAGRTAEAVATLSDAIARFPEAQLLHANLAAVYSRSGRHDESAATFRRMIDRGIADAITHLRLAWELERLGDLEGSAAQRAIYEAIRSNESGVDAPEP